MSLIIATGSNIGNCVENLTRVKELLQRKLQLNQASRIYTSQAVDYTDQDDFFNQVLEFKLPSDMTPQETMQFLLRTEEQMGRRRDIPKGPRTIDLDIIFWGNKKINEEDLHIPHPRWEQRSFVVRPLMELPFFQTLKKYSTIPTEFEIEAIPLSTEG